MLAYINPGTGSLFLQVLFMAIAGGAVAVKSHWNAFTRFFKRRK